MTKPLIYCVPPDLCGEVISRVEALVERGLNVAPEINRTDLMDRLRDRTVLMWIILRGMEPLAVGFTERLDDEDAVSVFGLAGRQVWQWAKPFAHTITEYARKEGVARVLFAGKAGWQRIIPNSEFVGMVGSQHIFERRTLQ